MALTNGIYKGKGLSLTINGNEYNTDGTSWALTSEDKDIVTFADLNAGNRQWTLTITTVMDMAADTLWRYVWDNAGTDDVAVLAKIYGNATASADQPHVSFTVTVPNQPDLSGDANANWTTDIAFEVTDQPTLVTS